MPKCVEAFCESGLAGTPLQLFVDEKFPLFACEAEPCSPHSPGPVSNDEEIAFLLIDPGHYDAERRTVMPDAFRELTTRDLSVVRAHLATRAEVEKTKQDLIARGADRIPPSLRSVDEVCIAKVEEVRAADPKLGRLLALYDTGLHDNPAHASIFTSSLVLTDKRMRKAARERIHGVMTKRVEAYDEFAKTLKDEPEADASKQSVGTPTRTGVKSSSS